MKIKVMILLDVLQKNLFIMVDNSNLIGLIVYDVQFKISHEDNSIFFIHQIQLNSILYEVICKQQSFIIINLLMQRKQSKKGIKSDLFDLRFTPNAERQYNALNDPHANYYFVSSAAKQRLKDLKKSIKREKFNKSNEEKHMLKLIQQKIHFKFPKIKLALPNHKQAESLARSSRHHSINNMVGKHFQEAKRSDFTASSIDISQSDFRKPVSSLNKRQYLPQSTINHNEFIQFLAEKKNKLREQTVL